MSEEFINETALILKNNTRTASKYNPNVWCIFILGGCLGTVIAFQLGGALAESRFGWPATFWAMGSLCVAMFIVMSIFGAATPAEHKTISYAEKEFIMGKVDGVKKVCGLVLKYFHKNINLKKEPN